MDSQKELKSTDEINVEMRRSFSWNRAFFTCDGFLDAEELSNVIEGSGDDDVKHELQKIEEIESLEAKLFQEIEDSNKKSIGKSNKVVNTSSNFSSGKKDSRAKKPRAAPIKTTQATRSSPLAGDSGGSTGNKVRPSARSTSSKTGKAAAGSPSKKSVGITTKNKVVQDNTHISRTPPASPVSSGSPSSKLSVNQRSKRGSSVPRSRGSTVNSENPTAVDARRNDEWKASKPAVKLIPKTQSNISLNVKPPPVISHPSPTSGLLSNFSGSTAQCRSESSSPCDANQKSKSKGSSTANDRSKSSSKNRPTGHTPDRNGKQPAASCSETRSPNASKPRKLLASKPVAAVGTSLKPVSQKTTTAKPSKKQSSAKAKSSSGSSRGAENIVLASPEVMDIKGKLNALKMEIGMQKKDRCKETKTSRGKNGKGGSRSIKQMNN